MFMSLEVFMLILVAIVIVFSWGNTGVIDIPEHQIGRNRKRG